MNEFDLLVQLRSIAKTANNPDMLEHFDAQLAAYIDCHENPPDRDHEVWQYVTGECAFWYHR